MSLSFLCFRLILGLKAFFWVCGVFFVFFFAFLFFGFFLCVLRSEMFVPHYF